MATCSPTDMTSVPDGSSYGAGVRVRPTNDWPVLRRSHANLLVSGPREATRAFIVAVTPYLHKPLHDVLACDALPIALADGTLILRDVDALDSEQQERLLRWLDSRRNGQTRVISTTAAPLYAAVQTGTFSDCLYYRLNVVHLEVTAD